MCFLTNPCPSERMPACPNWITVSLMGLGVLGVSIKEIEGLTASQIKALNLSICLVSPQSRAGEGSEWERDYRGEILGRETDRW